MTEQDNTKNDHFQTSDKPELVLGQAPGRKPTIPDTAFILNRIRNQAVKTQSLEKTIKYINSYIERVNSL